MASEDGAAADRRAMSGIRVSELPASALLRKYVDGRSYTDCYVTEVGMPAGQAEYVEAFYTTTVFRLERFLLSVFLHLPSTDAEARELALGRRESFAAWTVEARESDQLLLADFRGATRSWLMSGPAPGAASTRLWLGSAVVAVDDRRFRALLGFHKLYSRVLLRTAAGRLVRTRRTAAA